MPPRTCAQRSQPSGPERQMEPGTRQLLKGWPGAPGKISGLSMNSVAGLFWGSRKECRIGSIHADLVCKGLGPSTDDYNRRCM